MIINGVLAVLWLVGFSLLSWWMSGTLTHVCNVANWHEDAGVMVCRIYKSLFTFALLGLVSTLLAFSLDLYVRQRATRRGIYHNMTPIDAKAPAHATAYPIPNTGASATNPFADPSNPFSDREAVPAPTSFPAASPGAHSPYANRMPSPYLQSPNDPESGTFSHGAHGERESKSPIEYFKGPFARKDRADKEGYEVPGEQFKYDDDTEYRGAHEDAMR
ncbi:MAG: hypothetical protein M1822_008674 [Bathelium mastoideum]|nr:MAG: hypothetical protein M1822_008674 [Bathelium mastoideum]